MRTYILRRVLQTIPLLVGISALTFLLLQLAPGQLRAAFELLTHRFERCCYGRQALSQKDYEAAHTLAEQILQSESEAPR